MEFWNSDSYFLFQIFFPITVAVAVYSLEKAQKVKISSATDIELYFLIFFDNCHGCDS